MLGTRHHFRRSTCVAILGVALACANGDDPGATTSEGETGIGPLPGESSSTSEVEETTHQTEDHGAVLYLAVLPADTILTLNLGMPKEMVFQVTATFEDGTSADVTDDVTWSIEDPSVGTMDGNTLSVPAFVDRFIASTVLSARLGDAVGRAQLTVVAYDPTEDFFFVLPFEDANGPQHKDLDFGTEVKSLDVFVNMDTTASMQGPIDDLAEALAGTVVPDIQAIVPDTHFGVGAFEEFPVNPYGIAGDQPFELVVPITEAVADVQTALMGLTLADGGDVPEAHFEALFQIATGEGLNGPGTTFVAPNDEGLGGVGFREGSLPVVVSITNAVSHDAEAMDCGRLYASPVADVAHSRADALQALDSLCARVVEVAVADPGAPPECTAMVDGRALAESTNAVIPPQAWDWADDDGLDKPTTCDAGECCTGPNGYGVQPNADGMCPMSFQVSAAGTGVAESFGVALRLLARYGTFDVTRVITGESASVDGVALDNHTTADFILSVTPKSFQDTPPGAADPILGDTSFEGVFPATTVTFDVAAGNNFVPQTSEPQVFAATIHVLADTCGNLDQRTVFILVPPEKLPPPG